MEDENDNLSKNFEEYRYNSEKQQQFQNNYNKQNYSSGENNQGNTGNFNNNKNSYSPRGGISKNAMLLEQENEKLKE